jgi:hypothetical protein
MSTRTPVRPTERDTHAPSTVPTRVTGPAPAPRSSRFWTLIAIAAVVVTAAVIAALLWLTPGADTGSERSQAEFSTVARLEEQARQERADLAATARLEAQAAAEQARQERADFATTARLEAEASAYAQARAEQAEGARWIAQAAHYEQLRQARANAASTARFDGLAQRELGR